MSFRQRRSPSPWPGAPEQSRKQLDAIGIPDEALCSETEFVRFLTDGWVANLGTKLDDLSVDQFWMLFDIVNSWYDMDTLHFTAFQRRRITTPEKD